MQKPSLVEVGPSLRATAAQTHNENIDPLTGWDASLAVRGGEVGPRPPSRHEVKHPPSGPASSSRKRRMPLKDITFEVIHQVHCVPTGHWRSR